MRYKTSYTNQRGQQTKVGEQNETPRAKERKRTRVTHIGKLRWEAKQGKAAGKNCKIEKGKIAKSKTKKQRRGRGNPPQRKRREEPQETTRDKNHREEGETTL